MPCSLAECWYSKRGKVPYTTTPLKKNSQPISKCLCQWQSWIWEWSAVAKQLELPCLRLIGQIRSMLSIFLQLPFVAAVCTNAEQVAKFPVILEKIQFIKSIWSCFSNKYAIKIKELVHNLDKFVQCSVFFFSFPSLQPTAIYRAGCKISRSQFIKLILVYFFISNWYVKDIHSSNNTKIHLRTFGIMLGVQIKLKKTLIQYGFYLLTSLT